MTAATPTFEQVTVEVSASERKALRAARIRGVILAALGVVAFQFAVTSFDTPAVFSFWVDKQLLWILTGVVTGGAGILQLVRGPSFKWRWTLLVVLPFWIIAGLAALLVGKPANFTGVLGGTLTLAAPISLGAFAGIISERSGMSNIAIEGKFLIGACVASVAASVAMLVGGEGANPTVAVLIGITAAAIAGALVSLLLAWLGIRWKVDQIIAGIVINIGALGITNFLYLRVLSKNTQFNTPPTVESLKIPVLSEFPVLGPILFSSRPTCTSRWQ
jgi:ABC-type uncharacterized transport system permease subunit